MLEILKFMINIQLLILSINFSYFMLDSSQNMIGKQFSK